MMPDSVHRSLRLHQSRCLGTEAQLCKSRREGNEHRLMTRNQVAAEEAVVVPELRHM